MIKTRINLYQKQLRPKVEILSLGSISAVWAVLIAVCAVTWLFFDRQASTHQASLDQLYEQNTQLEAQLESLQSQVAGRKPDPSLAERVAVLKESLDKRQRLLAELASRDALREHGFAAMMTDLATSNRDDIWLESFVISENSVTFNGQLSYPQAMPQWLASLGQTDSFTATTFGAARVFRNESKLYFELSTPREGTVDETENSRIGAFVTEAGE